MSRGEGVPWEIAAEQARRLQAQLAAVSARAKVAGSIRRRRPTVSDIEIVVEPAMRTGGLFAEGEPDLAAIRAVVRSWGRLTRAGDRYLHVEPANGLPVDVFVVIPPAQWGSILAIRTGPGDLGKHAVTRMRAYGLRHVEGYVEDGTGAVVPTPTEEAFFALAGLACLPPARRQFEEARASLSAADRAGAIARTSAASEQAVGR